jgi:predicted RecB family nuclease
MNAHNDSSTPVLLGGYAAKQCAVRTQNDHLPIARRWIPSPEDQVRLDAGIAFEEEIFARLLALQPAAVIIDPQCGRDEAIESTVAAIRAGAPLILGGWLPDDPAGGRKGRPDILVAAEGGYLPADVKHHRSAETKPRKQAFAAALSDPADWQEVPGWSPATLYRYSDGLQLAHYTRQLQNISAHPGEHRMWGAILGTTDIPLTADTQPEAVFVWHDLAAPLGYTFSRSSNTGKRRRSLLERYDHEHSFRVKVAETARRATQTGDMTTLLVAPVGQGECAKCPYTEVCADQMGPDDPSAAITVGGLDTREWLTLRRLGITTTADLAEVDTTDPDFFTAYHREVAHRGRDHTRTRLGGAIQRAKMIRAGVTILRTADHHPLPGADIEIDLDIEWDQQGRTYLWGARMRCGGDDTTATYTAFTDWNADLDDRGEYELAVRCADWLRIQRDTAAAAGQSLRVFHWSSPEPARLRKILGADATHDLLGPDSGLFVDLEDVFKHSFLSLHGTSIKKVAPEFGFAWAAEDAGGATSQTYLAAVHAGGDTAEHARRWLLAYNTDDCAAMAAIRDGMAEWPESVSTQI